MIKVKFCGLTREKDISAANELSPDYIGFVFAPKSRRKIDVSSAKVLKSKLNSNIKAVGVFVNEDINKITEIANDNVIDIIQLHGDEDDRYVENLKTLSSKSIIQAVQVKNLNDIKKANKSAADYILLDSGQGGGTIFDWTLAKKITRPYFLAGGLNISNVKEAVEKLNPFAVDVSSGIETDGVKDKEKMREFISYIKLHL